MSQTKAFPPKITRRGFLRAGVRTGIGLAAFSGGSLAYAKEIEPDWVQVTHLDVPLARLPRVFDGFRIAQISDIHIEFGDMRTQLPHIARLVNQQKADLIALTGDYISYRSDWQEEALFQGLRHLHAPQGVFAVMGNHDRWSGAAQPRRALERAGIRVLLNEAERLERGNSVLWVAGVDDWMTGYADTAPIESRIPDGQATVLLAHEPDLVDQLASRQKYDLMLSGHSHGGQVTLPFGNPIHVPIGAKKYPRGLYQVGQTTLYTNRGLGTVSIPLRFCARPEITIFTLKAASAEGKL